MWWLVRKKVGAVQKALVSASQLGIAADQEPGVAVAKQKKPEFSFKNDSHPKVAEYSIRKTSSCLRFAQNLIFTSDYSVIGTFHLYGAHTEGLPSQFFQCSFPIC